MNQDRGVSPVISVILMLGLAVSIAAIASLTAFDLQNDVATNPDITLQANDGDATATVVDAGNVDELKLDGVTVNSDVNAGDTLDLAGAGSSASVIAVANGQEQLVKQVETGVPFSEPNNKPNKSNVNLGDLDGSGDPGDPYQISTDQELQAMNENRNADYVLVNNIDAGKSGQWNGGNGFNPVGENNVDFNGSFDGQGHTIAGLTIDRPNTGEVGLFEETGSDAEITNVTVTTADVTGTKNVGGLVAFNRGSVENASASGSVTGSGNDVGGLVGQNNDNVENASTSGSVTGGDDVGGLVGRNAGNGNVKNSFTSATVTGTKNVGGLVGINFEVVKKSSASGTVTGSGNSVGGLVGISVGTVKKSSASASVTGGENVGGMVGFSNGEVSNVSSTSSVDGDVDTGGLVGDNRGIISNASVSGDTDGRTNVGGLAGRTRGEITNASASGDVTGSNGNVGGLVGLNQASDGDISNTFASGSVTGSVDDVAGLVGQTDSTVSGSYWLNTTDSDIGEIDGNNVSGVETGATSGGDFTLTDARGASASNDDVMGDDFDFTNTWETVDGEFPILQNLDTQAQLDAR